VYRVFDYYFRRDALRLGAVHFALTVLFVFFSGSLSSVGVMIANVFRHPMVLLLQLVDGIPIPATLQWPLLILNSLLWGFMLVWLTRKLRRKCFDYRLAREAKRQQRDVSKYQI
jgi:hypothetical protein